MLFTNIINVIIFHFQYLYSLVFCGVFFLFFVVVVVVFCFAATAFVVDFCHLHFSLRKNFALGFSVTCDSISELFFYIILYKVI